MKKKLWYYLKKILLLILAMIVLSLMVFYMSRIAPGDPLYAYYGDRVDKMSVEERDQIMDRLGLNQPIFTQYVIWAQNALHGDFGISYKYKQDVTEVIGHRLGNTLLLSGLGFILTFIFALLLGLFCAARENHLIDRICCQLGTVTSCIPSFWMALLLILIFSVWLGLLPSSGAYALGKAGSIISRLQHLILPISVLIISHLWYYAYMIRNKLLEEIRQDYVNLARAQGMSSRYILLHHCLRNIMPAYINLMALSLPHILGGAYVVEMVFSYPGIGTLAFESAKYHDYNLLMLICLITGLAVITCNMLGQIISERLDPRMKAPELTTAMEVE